MFIQRECYFVAYDGVGNRVAHQCPSCEAFFFLLWFQVKKMAYLHVCFRAFVTTIIQLYPYTF